MLTSQVAIFVPGQRSKVKDKEKDKDKDKDKEAYEQKVADMLSDTRTYSKLDSDPTPKYKRKLIGMLSWLCKESKITGK